MDINRLKTISVDSSLEWQNSKFTYFILYLEKLSRGQKLTKSTGSTFANQECRNILRDKLQISEKKLSHFFKKLKMK